MRWPTVVREWGSTPAERERAYPCDRVMPQGGDTMFRAVSVAAPAPLVFRWLCQMRVAPYSYDLLDNRARRSPQELTPGLDELEIGQRLMIFKLVDFEPERSLTLFSRGRLFGDVAATYSAEPDGPERSRLIVKFVVDYSNMGLQRHLMSKILPPGDLVMMRRQLLNFKRLAERDAAA